MEVWKIIFLSKWVICRFHVNLPGCTNRSNAPFLRKSRLNLPYLHLLFACLNPQNGAHATDPCYVITIVTRSAGCSGQPDGARLRAFTAILVTISHQPPRSALPFKPKHSMYFWQYFANLDFPEIRGPISLTKPPFGG